MMASTSVEPTTHVFMSDARYQSDIHIFIFNEDSIKDSQKKLIAMDKKRESSEDNISNVSESNDSNNFVEEKPGKFWVILLVVVISLTRIGHGIFFSLSGPTLLYLTENVNASVTQLSSMLTGRSAGFFVGTIIFGIIKNRFKSHKPLTIIAIGIVLGGVLMLVTPWVTDLWLLVVITTITGLMFGYFDAGLQSLYLQLWGEEGSRPHIQSFHFTFGVGAFLAPIIAGPFLQMADQNSSADESCSNKNVDFFTTIGYTTSEQPVTSAGSNSLNPVAWTYIMSGAFTIVIGGVMLLCALLRIEDKVQTNHSETAEQRPEEPIRDVALLFVPVVIYYFMCASMEAVYQSYVYSIALCSDLAFSVADATTLNTLFWVGFMVGRGSGIIYANFFTPTTIIVVDLVGTTTAMIVLSIFGSYVSLVIWIVSVFHGLAVATLYPSGVSWTSLITNVSGTYILIFGAGNTVGTMTMLPLGGALFDISPFNVVYQILAMSICNCLAFLAMTWLGKRHLAKVRLQESRTSLSSISEIEEKERSVVTHL